MKITALTPRTAQALLTSGELVFVYKSVPVAALIDGRLVVTGRKDDRRLTQYIIGWQRDVCAGVLAEVGSDEYLINLIANR